MKLSRVILGVLLGVQVVFGGTKYYVSVNGNGSGTKASPFALGTGLQASSTVRPGDTLHILPGIYRNPVPGPVNPSQPNDGQCPFPVTLSGSVVFPIVIECEGYVGIDGMDTRLEDIVRVSGSFLTIKGMDVYSSDLLRTELTTPADGNTSFPKPTEVRRGTGISIDQNVVTRGIKLINCSVHDCFVGIGNTAENSLGLEIYGCIVYNNGFNSLVDRPHGHNFYLQNYLLNERVQDNNIVWGAYENNVQAYGGDGARRNTSNFKFRRTVSFNPGDGRNLLVGGANIADNLTLDSSYTYHSGTGRNLDLGWVPYGAGASGLVRGNYFVGGGIYFQSPISIDFSGNYVYYINAEGFSPSAYPNNIYASGVPDRVVVLPNKYESGRAHIVVYNGSRRGSVTVDLSGVLAIGESFSIWDSQNLRGAPVVSGVYTAPVGIPMAAGPVEQPVGGDSQNGARVSSRPVFFAGLLRRTGDPLPVVFSGPPRLTLLSGDRVKAEFITLSEIGSFRFYLQKEVSGAWISVDSCGAAGTTNIPQSYTLTDPNKSTGSPLFRIKETDLDGSVHYSESVQIAITSVVEPPIRAFSLFQNYPNPFNPSTVIRYEVKDVVYVRLEVYNVQGQKIGTLREGVHQGGVYDVTVNASDWPSGTYYYTLKAGNFVATKRFTLIK